MPITTWLLLLGVFAYSFVRTRDTGVVTFFWFPLIFMTIGTTSFSKYQPPPIQARYYAFVILVAIVMTAVAASIALERWRARRPKAYTRFALVASLGILGVYEARAALPMSGTFYRALDAQAFIAAIDRAGELYPGYPIVVAPYFSGRMGPILAEHANVVSDPVSGSPRPPPPYIYIRKATASVQDEADPKDPDPLVLPPQRIETSLIIPPPGKRWRLIKQRLFGGGPSSPGSADRWVEILVVR
jgi:hypothetical protein